LVANIGDARAVRIHHKPIVVDGAESRAAPPDNGSGVAGSGAFEMAV